MKLFSIFLWILCPCFLGAENSPSGVTFNTTKNKSAILTWLPPPYVPNCSFNYTVNINSYSVTEQMYTNSTSLILTDFTHGENYSFAVAVTDSTGQHGPWSEELRVDGGNYYTRKPTQITYPIVTTDDSLLFFKQMVTASTRTTYPAIAASSTLPSLKSTGFWTNFSLKVNTALCMPHSITGTNSWKSARRIWRSIV